MVQIQFLNKILKTQSVDIVLDNDITVEYFDEFPDEFNFIMEHYHKYGNVPDIPTFIHKFEDFDITEVTESDEYLLDTLYEEYQYRELVPIIKRAASMLKEDSVGAVDYLRTAMHEVSNLASGGGIDIIKESGIRLAEYQKHCDSDKPWLIPTGFQELDEVMGGLRPGEEFMVIVARTNQGKSWILCKILEHICKVVGLNVGYISPEMSGTSIGYRFDSLYGHFSNFALSTGKEVDGYEEYIKDLQESTDAIFQVITPNDPMFNKKITISKLRKFCKKYDLKVLGIDGITYLSDERYRRGDNKTTSLTNISEDLMELSCELGIPIITVVQANRNGVDETGEVPALETIRDSDGIAHNATTVLSLRQSNAKLKMEITKARNCKVGTKLTYNWDIDTGNFTYNANPEEETEEVTSRYSRQNTQQREPVVNTQPLRRTPPAPLPF